MQNDTSRGPLTRSTTILGIQRDGQTAIGGDGQVTLGETVVKGQANKIRKLNDDTVLTGFAGSAADAFALLERFEGKLKEFRGSLPRAANEFARDWRTDKFLRHLQAFLIVMDKEHSFLLSGSGDIIQPEDGILAIGSGSSYARAAARAYLDASDLSVREIVERSLRIAGDICIYTNHNIAVEEL